MEWTYYEQNSNTNGRRPVMAEDLDTGEIMYFWSIHDAATSLEVPTGNITKCCKGLYKSTYGYKFSYLHNDEDAGDCPVHGFSVIKRIQKDQYLRRRGTVHTSKKAIVVVNKITKKYRIYTNITRLCLDMELDKRNVYKCLTKPWRYKSYAGYNFYYEDGIDTLKLNGQF